MITVVEGRPGMGKSVWLVSQILRYLMSGYLVITNVELQLSGRHKKMGHDLAHIEDLSELTDVNLKDIYGRKNWKGKPYRGIKVVLDEVQTYLNSRNWDKLDIRLQLLLQQHRKRGMDIVGATQSIKRADVVFRELVQVFYRIRKIVSFRLPYTKLAFGFFYLREYDPDDIESGGAKSNQKALSWFIPFFADPYTFRVYDTTQEYEPVSRVGQTVVEEYVIISKPQEVRQLVSKRTVDKSVVSG